MKTQSFTLHTEKQGCYDITAAVHKCISDAGIQSGLCVVFCPHTTAAIAVSKRADVAEDTNNTHTCLMHARASEAFIVEDGKLLLGTWQGIYLVETDGPCIRTYFVKVMADTEGLEPVRRI